MLVRVGWAPVNANLLLRRHVLTPRPDVLEIAAFLDRSPLT